MRPERTNPFLASLAAKAKEERFVQLKVPGTYVEKLLDPCARIEESEQESVISSALRPITVGSF